MRALITGGCGFVGANLARALLRRNHHVTVLDNCSRPGVRQNLAWLERMRHRRWALVVADVRDYDAVRQAVAGQTMVFHLASQVAVTSSLDDPRRDFEINLLGTINVLEALRSQPPGSRPGLIFTSTNKVYGQLDQGAVSEGPCRYSYADPSPGISESQPLDFHSPYGCSKGAADQYVRDYARVYGLATVVFRMSCIYGPRQFGSEDQGWVAHFIISALLGRPVTIYGSGRQVRDVLFIDDLVAAFLAAAERLENVRGEVFNIGGGAASTLSLMELVDWINQRCSGSLRLTRGPCRVGDQSIYVSDISKAAAKLRWQPQVPVWTGLEKLWSWVERNRELLAAAASATRDPALQRSPATVIAITGVPHGDSLRT